MDREHAIGIIRTLADMRGICRNMVYGPNSQPLRRLCKVGFEVTCTTRDNYSIVCVRMRMDSSPETGWKPNERCMFTS
jgi:hypothetical protein